jgi:hypothetical protein
VREVPPARISAKVWRRAISIAEADNLYIFRLKAKTENVN